MFHPKFSKTEVKRSTGNWSRQKWAINRSWCLLCTVFYLPLNSDLRHQLQFNPFSRSKFKPQNFTWNHLCDLFFNVLIAQTHHQEEYKLKTSHFPTFLQKECLKTLWDTKIRSIDKRFLVQSWTLRLSLVRSCQLYHVEFRGSVNFSKIKGNKWEFSISFLFLLFNGR